MSVSEEEEITFAPTYRFERLTRDKYAYTKQKATGVSPPRSNSPAPSHFLCPPYHSVAVPRKWEASSITREQQKQKLEYTCRGWGCKSVGRVFAWVHKALDSISSLKPGWDPASLTPPLRRWKREDQEFKVTESLRPVWAS